HTASPYRSTLSLHDALPIFKKGDSFFQSIRSNRPTKWMDTYAYQLKHLIEFGNHVSLQSSFIHHRRRAIGDLQFLSSGDDPYDIDRKSTRLNSSHVKISYAV